MKFLCPSAFYILDIFRYHLVDSLSYLQERCGGFGAFVKGDFFAKEGFDFFYDAVSATELFGKLEGARILQGFIKGEDAHRFNSASILCGVDRKGISRREHMTCAGIEEGVDGVAREGGIVKVISPMQKSNNVEFVKLQTNGARSPQGHCNKAVGNTLVLRTAIVGPKSLDVCLDERLDMIV